MLNANIKSVIYVYIIYKPSNFNFILIFLDKSAPGSILRDGFKGIIVELVFRRWLPIRKSFPELQYPEGHPPREPIPVHC